MCNDDYDPDPDASPEHPDAPKPPVGDGRPVIDTEIIRRYRDTVESQRGIARDIEVTRGYVDRCLTRNKIEKRPRPPVWTAEEKWHLVIVCNSKNLSGQCVTGQEFKKFFPNHTYSSIKHHRDVLRSKGLIR